MSAYLSADWAASPIDPLAEALADAGTRDLRIGRIVTKAPDGEVRFTAAVAGGSVTYEPGIDDDVEVTLTDTYPNALALARGELDPNAAFIRGQTKVTGPTSALLDLLAAARSPRYEAARAELASALEG